MNVLVINAGSSSLKYQLVNVERHELLAKGICERVGSAEAFHKHGLDENEVVIDARMADHDDAMALVLDSLTEGATKAIDSLDEIDAVGHRIVQGGKYFERSVLIDDDVIAKIDELAELAPLHNKAALMGINACLKHMPDVPMVAVFDTSFFQTLPPKAYMYPLPYELLREVRHPQVRRARHVAPLHLRARRRRAGRAAGRPQAHHLPSGQRLLDVGHRPRGRRGHLHGPHAARRPHDGHALRRHRPGHRAVRHGAREPYRRRDERPHEQEVGPSGHFRHLQRPAQRPRRLREGRRACHAGLRHVLELGEEVHRQLHRRHGRRGRHRAHGRSRRELREDAPHDLHRACSRLASSSTRRRTASAASSARYRPTTRR